MSSVLISASIVESAKISSPFEFKIKKLRRISFCLPLTDAPWKGKQLKNIKNKLVFMKRKAFLMDHKSRVMGLCKGCHLDIHLNKILFKKEKWFLKKEQEWDLLGVEFGLFFN